jgi:hypothetical protein
MISKKRFEELAQSLGLEKVVTNYFDLIDEQTMGEFTFDQWKNILNTFPLSELTMDRTRIIISLMRVKHTGVKELFYLFKLSTGCPEQFRSIEHELSRTGTQEEWFEIFKSLNSTTDHKVVKDFVVKKVQSFF